MRLSRITTLFLLCASALMLAVIPALAQDDDSGDIVTERVDQAMAHLTEFVGSERPISRQVHFWRWQEQIWPDAGLGCPIPDEVYDAAPNRGPNVTITFDDVEYDYRLSWDGSILVLCGADGLPLFRSDDPALSPDDADMEGLPDLPGFNAWVYQPGQDRFYLVNSTQGAVADFGRPSVPQESEVIEIGFSRDGRYLLQVIELEQMEEVIVSGVTALVINDLQTGDQRTLLSGGGRLMGLGAFGYDLADGRSGVPRFARSLGTNSANNTVAVAMWQEEVTGNDWEIALINLQSGAVTASMSVTNFLDILQDDVGEMASYLEIGSFRPIPVLIDETGGVHFYLVLLFAGGALEYPAFVWNPALNIASSSQLGHTMMDLMPDGQAVFAVYDENFPAAPGPHMMLDPINVIVQMDGLQMDATPTPILAGSDRVIIGTRWAADGDQVIYRTFDDPAGTPFYAVVDVNTGGQYRIDRTGYGAPGGVLTTVAGGGELIYVQDPATSTIIWAGAGTNEEPIVAWVETEGQSLGLTQVMGGAVAPPSGAPPADTTTDPGACGTLDSIVSVGIAARSTVIDGATLNVRTRPTTSAPVARIIPEDARFRIIGGPACADGFTWWQIVLDADGLDGWVAESGADRYFIEPAP